MSESMRLMASVICLCAVCAPALADDAHHAESTPIAAEMSSDPFIIDEPHVTISNHAAASQAEAVFQIVNTSGAPMTITRAKTSCGCTVAEWPKDPIAPGATAVIRATLKSGRNPGASVTRTVHLFIAGERTPVELRVTVQTAQWVVPSLTQVELSTLATHGLTLTAADGEAFSVVSVKPAVLAFSDHVSAKHDLTLLPDTALDPNRDIVITTDHPLESRVVIRGQRSRSVRSSGPASKHIAGGRVARRPETMKIVPRRVTAGIMSDEAACTHRLLIRGLELEDAQPEMFRVTSTGRQLTGDVVAVESVLNGLAIEIEIGGAPGFTGLANDRLYIETIEDGHVGSIGVIGRVQ